MQYIDIGHLAVGLLLSVRLGALALIAPPLGGGMVPPSVRVAVVLSWAAVLSASLVSVPQWLRGDGLPSLGPLLLAAATEGLLGALMGLGINMAFAIFTFAARLVDTQIGFGMGQVFDPMTHRQVPILSAIFSQLALVAFFLLDAHHALLRGVAFSVDMVPPGSPWAVEPLLPAIARQCTSMFSLGFAMAAPVVFCLTLVEFGLGLLSRSLPQMNTLLMGMPVKVVAGIAALALWTGTGEAVMRRAYASGFALWEALWR